MALDYFLSELLVRRDKCRAMVDAACFGCSRLVSLTTIVEILDSHAHLAPINTPAL
jgi:hypothetical protein